MKYCQTCQKKNENKKDLYCLDCKKGLLRDIKKAEKIEIPIIGEIVEDKQLGNKVKYYEKVGK